MSKGLLSLKDMALNRKYGFVVLMTLLSMIFSLTSSAQDSVDASSLQLANRYYQQKEFEKAAVLYKEFYDSTESQAYFQMYLSCLIGIPDFETASEEIEKAAKKNKKNISFYVQWAYLLSEQGLDEESEKMLAKALELVNQTKAGYVSLSNSFISFQMYTFAEKVFLAAKEQLPEEDFYYELGRVYRYQRDYEKMFDEYILMIKNDATKLSRMQSSVLSAFRSDVDDSLHEYFRKLMLKKIQEEPDVIVYNRMLIWYYLQMENYSSALRQQIALDKRTGNESDAILELAQVAGNNGEYTEALDAYDYLIEKGEGNSFFRTAQLERMQLEYQQFTETKTKERNAEELHSRFVETLNLLGYSAETYSLLIDYSHFLAFYYGQAETAISLLTEALDYVGLTEYQQGLIKTELADVNVYGGDMYEAILLYSQVIEENRTNDLGDEAKLKKAKLGYYMGELDWAKAQLDVIKASTEKLVANDAMQLSIFISTNLSSDTTQVPVQLFAEADLLSFRNQQEESWAILDSIETNYPYNSLIDDIYYRKANLLVANGDFEDAASYYEKIISTYSYDLLGDDALFELAGLYKKLDRNEDAENLYKTLLLQFPGSVYASQARNEYRGMESEERDTETEFMNGDS